VHRRREEGICVSQPRPYPVHLEVLIWTSIFSSCSSSRHLNLEGHTWTFRIKNHKIEMLIVG
jgi:hypothetical protein